MRGKQVGPDVSDLANGKAMPLRGTVEASLNQLEYHSQDADPRCFLAQRALPSPGRHPGP